MKKLSMVLVGAVLSMAVHAAETGKAPDKVPNKVSDRVSGSPKANFNTDELTIPCVRIESLSAETEGAFYDIVLKRRGKSFNYELTAADAEDPVQCQRIADFADFEEDEEDEPELLAQCAATATRSKVAVQSKELEAGDYYAIVTSGDNTIESEVKTTDEGELEFDFDSDSAAVIAGAEAIEDDFITDDEVTVELFSEADDDEALLTATATCLTAG
ncbi:MAG: hypothetical protein V4603_00540 [Pseudomonadota bacterium]